MLSFERTPEVDPTSAMDLHGTETVVVVEDDAAVRELAVRVLRGYGYTVISASDGYAATTLTTAHHGPIHLLVTDVVLSGKRGTALATELAAARPDVRVLFVSGYADDGASHDAVPTPRVALLQKPFTPLELVRKVREVLDGEA